MDNSEEIVRRAQNLLDTWNRENATLQEYYEATRQLWALTSAKVLLNGGMYEIKNYAQGIVDRSRS